MGCCWHWICLVGCFLWKFLGASVLISSPFDNFRLECSQMSGAQRISVRMVESQGQKRQDTVFAISCNSVQELYPWFGIPMGVEDIEREDCHYSPMMDPIMDDSVNYTCGPREYISGITRMTDTRIQIMCCRLRSRDEKNCVEKKFSKPIVNEGRIEIENNAQLINALSIKGNYYVARFCDLGARAIGFIVEDLPTTTRKPTTNPWTKRTPRTRTRTILPVAATPTTTPTSPTTSQRATLTSSEPWWLTTTTRYPMRVIKVAQPAFLRNPQAWDLNMEQHMKAQLPDDQVRFERLPYTEVRAPVETSTLSQNDINSQNEQSENLILTVFPGRNEQRRHQTHAFFSTPYVTQRTRSSGEILRQRKVSNSNEVKKHLLNKPYWNSQPIIGTLFPKQTIKQTFAKQHGVETSFPKHPNGKPAESHSLSQEEYDDKTSKELMKSIVDFMEAQRKAKNMIEKVKSSENTHSNKEQFQLARQMLKEFEEISPEIVGSLIKSTEKNSNTPIIDFKSIEQVSVPQMRFSNNPNIGSHSSVYTIPFTQHFETSTSSTAAEQKLLFESTPPPATALNSLEDMMTALSVTTPPETYDSKSLRQQPQSKEHLSNKKKSSLKDKSKRLYLFISSTVPSTTTTAAISDEDWFHQMSEVITQSAMGLPITVPETTTISYDVKNGRHKPRLVSGSIEVFEDEGMEYGNSKEAKGDGQQGSAEFNQITTAQTTTQKSTTTPRVSSSSSSTEKISIEKSEEKEEEYEDITDPKVTDSSLMDPSFPISTTKDPFYATMNTTTTWSTAGEIYDDGKLTEEPLVPTIKITEEKTNLENWKSNDVEIRKAPQKVRPVDEFVSLAPFEAFPSPPEQNVDNASKLKTHPIQAPRFKYTTTTTNPLPTAQFAPAIIPLSTQTPIHQENFENRPAIIKPRFSSGPVFHTKSQVGTNFSSQQQIMIPQTQGVRSAWEPPANPIQPQQVWAGGQIQPWQQIVPGQTPQQIAPIPQMQQQQFLGQNQQFLTPNQHPHWMLQHFHQPQQQVFQQPFQQQFWPNPQFNGAQGVVQVPSSQIQSQVMGLGGQEQPYAPTELYPTITTRTTQETETAATEPPTQMPRSTQNPKYPFPSARGKILHEPYMDEETEDSPFDVNPNSNRHEHSTQENGPSAIDPKVLGAFSYDETPQVVEYSENKPISAIDVSREIRRSPTPRHNHYSDQISKVDSSAESSPSRAESIRKFPATKTTNLIGKFDNNIVFPTFDEYQNTQNQEYEVDMPKGVNEKDGVKTFQPPKGEPLKTGTMGTQLIVFDTLDSMNENGHSQPTSDRVFNEKDRKLTNSKEKFIALKKRRPIKNTTPDGAGIETTLPTTYSYTVESSSTEEPTTSEYLKHPQLARDSVFSAWETRKFWDVPNLSSTTTEAYDLNKFYHTQKPKRPIIKEKYLTFCTKNLAIRDESDMVIACGSELEIWQPNRCPPNADCFIVPDSSYRICCPVYRGRL